MMYAWTEHSEVYHRATIRLLCLVTDCGALDESTRTENGWRCGTEPPPGRRECKHCITTWRRGR